MKFASIFFCAVVAACGSDLAATDGESATGKADGPAETRRIDAALESPDGAKTFFFRGGAYRRYAWDRDLLDDGGSLPLFAFHLPGSFQQNVRATLAGRGAYDGYAYFFRGDEYVRYNWRANRVDYGPASIADEWGLPFAPTAAVNGAGPYAGYAYFFAGAEYVRYDWANGTTSERQSLVPWSLPAPFDTGFDTAVAGRGAYAGKVYFVKGDQYVRYDWATANVDSPVRSLASGWPALEGLTAPATRRVVLYVSIDPWDPHRADGGIDGHQPNLDRLRAVASAGLLVDDFWADDVSAAMLRDPHVLAVFGSGSFHEWHNVFTDDTWSRMLDRWAALIRTTDVPMLAVCGTHQLIGRIYAGWEAVGHMNGPAIAGEEDGPRIPSPRANEHGVYPISADEADPLFAGIGSPMTFVESHSDEVVDGKFAPGFTRIATAARAVRAERLAAYAAGPDYRAAVQALRSDDPTRILYTVQFHPELPADHSLDATFVAAADASGARLIGNFLTMARDFW